MRNILPAAMLLTLAAAAPAANSAPVRLCSFEHSATAALDRQVAKAVFEHAGLAYTMVDPRLGGTHGKASAADVAKLLATRCDAFIGVPVPRRVGHLRPASTLSIPYFDSDFVKFRVASAQPAAHAPDSVAVAYASPAQIIAAQEHDTAFDVLADTRAVIRAVARGDDASGIAWYPSLVAYEQRHPQVHFRLQPTHSSISQWQLSFLTDRSHAALARRITASVRALRQDAELPRLIAPWRLRSDSDTAPRTRAPLAQDAVYHPGDGGSMLRTAGSVQAAATADFAQQQVGPGRQLFATDCARCHGAQLQGGTAPALRGPGFAPSSGSTMTVGGIYQYMSTNMPADKPGQLQAQQYADIMAYLLHANGYAPSGLALDPAHAGDDQTPFDSFAK